MKKMVFQISGFIFMLSAGMARGQGPVSVRASVDRQQILIGEPIRLNLEARLPPGNDSAWFSSDSLPHFEYISPGKTDSLFSTDERILRREMIITSFDSGRWVIPPITLTVDKKEYLTDSIPVTVDYSKFDPRQDYHDIKDILDVNNPYTRYIGWGIGALTLCSLLLFLFFATRKKKLALQVEEKKVPLRSPLEEAILALEALRKQGLVEKGAVKDYYAELIDIFRRFIWRRFLITSMEKTNEELILRLRELKIPDKLFSGLTQVLRMSDFVKFAKYLPADSTNSENFETIHYSIEQLNPMET
jgi:hypothetical protein